MRANKIDKFLERAIEKMFQMVGFKSFDKDFAKQENWFTLKSWTPSQEQEFKAWFIKSAKEDLKWSKPIAEKEFSYFNFMYGWTLDEDINTGSNYNLQLKK